MHSKEIFITATAKIYNKDNIEAKARVIKNAQLKVVKKGVEIFLVKKTINENYQVIREQIYNFNQKFISNLEVLSQDIDLEKRYIEVTTFRADEKKNFTHRNNPDVAAL